MGTQVGSSASTSTPSLRRLSLRAVAGAGGRPFLPSSSSSTSSTSASLHAGSRGPRPIWLPASLLLLFCLTLLSLHTDATPAVAELSASIAHSAHDKYDELRVKLAQQLPYSGKGESTESATVEQLAAIERLEPAWRWASNTSIVYTASWSEPTGQLKLIGSLNISG